MRVKDQVLHPYKSIHTGWEKSAMRELGWQVTGHIPGQLA